LEPSVRPLKPSWPQWSPPLGGGTISIGTGWIGASGPPQWGPPVSAGTTSQALEISRDSRKPQ
jgi:hypothetical protein